MKACSIKGVTIGRMDIVTKEFSKRSKQSNDISKAKPKLELVGCGLNDESVSYYYLLFILKILILFHEDSAIVHCFGDKSAHCDS